MISKLERDRDNLFQDLIKTARDYRFHNRFEFDHVVQVSIPPRQKHLVTARDIAQLEVFWIKVVDAELVPN